MKKIASLSLLTVALLLGSCSTDFELEGEWKDIPNVNAFLSIQDTAHYVRVEKVFLEVGGNALEIAQIPDSLYYDKDKITVQLEKVQTGEIFTLDRVDGNLEGYPREEGVFANVPNYLYKIRANAIDLEGTDEVRLILNRGDALENITAETVVLSDLELNEARPPQEISLTDYSKNLTIRWASDEFTRIFDVRFVVHYKESQEGASDFVDKTLTWVIDDSYQKEEGTEVASISVKWEQFYIFLKNNIDASQNRNRRLVGLELHVTGAGEELVEFLRIAQANSGITSSQSIPRYSNLSGDGLGIFSSRTTATRTGITVVGLACDSLRNGIHTGNLNFIACQ